jgi:general secretion pathway protein N
MRYLCLTSALLLIWTTAAPGADAPASPQASNGVTLANPLAALTMEQLSAIVDRPLFSPNRRGAPTAAVARDPEPQTQAPTPPPSLVLSGVVMDGGGARVVVLVGPERKAIRAQIGDEIGGWTVTQIEGRKLVLSLGGRIATFTLFNREGAK